MTKHFDLEEKIQKLEEIESYFQKPDMHLDEAIKKHQEALGLAKEILDYLKKAQTSIEKMDISNDDQL